MVQDGQSRIFSAPKRWQRMLAIAFRGKLFAFKLIAYSLLACLAAAVPGAAVQPIDPTILTTYVGNQVSNVSTAPEVGEPVPPRAKFFLRAPATVETGKPVTVEIVREQSDGRAHSFHLQFQPEGMVRDPPTTITIGDPNASWIGAVATVETSPDDGPTKLTILLTPGDSGPEIGVPRVVEVTLTPAPKPVTYVVQPPQVATVRGNEVVFIVTRQNGTGEARVIYNVTQGSTLISSGELTFNDENGPQNIGFANYNPCGEPLSFALLGTQGQTSATAAFGELPAACIVDNGGEDPGIGGIPKDWWPWVLIPLALPVIWYGVRRIWPPKPKPLPEPLLPPQPREPETPPMPEVHGSFGLKPGESSFPKGQPKLRLPEIRQFMRVTLGKSTCPNPLLLREKMDG